jgi:dolichyl-phosphate beta-glucosyltransferase
MPSTTVVVPCYNEEKRIKPESFRPLVTQGGMRVMFVDDGSTDETRARLQAACTRGEGFSLLPLEKNNGKAEAVRAGMLLALERGAPAVGYLDADLATPAEELLRLRETMKAAGAAVAFGSRVRLLGTQIERSAARHYIGRIFATVASRWTLRVPVYDTQCGAKIFERTPALEQALAKPFESTWTFDVELLGRLLYGAGHTSLRVADFLEMPLREWRDVAGSKVRLRHGLGALWDLCWLGRRFASLRRSSSRA